jgi:hypothetical protein
MSVIVASKEEVQKYYESEALGQSKLKLLLGDISSFNKEFDSSAEHFLIGSAVDCILTNSREAFNAEYYTSEIEKLPSDAIIEILKLVHENLLEDYAESLEVITTEQETASVTPFAEFVGELGNWEAYVLEACERTGWQPRWGAEAKFKNVLLASDYFMDLCKAFGKTVISQSQANTIHTIVASLTGSPRTARYFDRRTLEDYAKVEVYYQFPVYFEYRGVQCKALLDIVIVERNDAGEITGVTPVDLKTMNGNTYYFPSSIKTRRYDIQAAWYTLALEKHFGPGLIKPFQFVVESTSYQGKPLLFEVEQSLLEIGRAGIVPVILSDIDVVLKQEVLGYEQLLDLYIYHSENGFNEERAIQEAGLQPLKVDWNGIK